MMGDTTSTLKPAGQGNMETKQCKQCACFDENIYRLSNVQDQLFYEIGQE